MIMIVKHSAQALVLLLQELGQGSGVGGEGPGWEWNCPPGPHLQPAQPSLQSWTVLSIFSSSASSPWEKEGVPDSGGSSLQMAYSLRKEGHSCLSCPLHRFPDFSKPVSSPELALVPLLSRRSPSIMPGEVGR